jgi:integrase
MPVIRVRGRLRLLVKDEAGEWRQRALGLADTPENWPIAERKLREVERELAALRRNAPPQGGPLTVESWGTRWLLTRTNRDAENDASRLRLHVFPVIGALPLAEVEPRHVNALQKTWDRAPRTRRNIYSVLQAMFRDAEIEGLVPRGQNPCILTHRQMGTISDSPGFVRHEHVFTRDELEALISDERVPQDRRVWYALLGVGMVRVGEAAGLRWGRVLACEPLGRMIVSHSYEGTTKTGKPRWMPIHPTLAGILAEWRLGGWARTFGRPPTPEDLVCPVPPEPPRKGKRKEPGSMRDKNWCRKRIVVDLVTLEIRHRRAHDLRRTGISLATSDGASESMLNRGTHAPPNKVMDLYITPEWEALCREVGKMRISRSSAPRASRET